MYQERCRYKRGKKMRYSEGEKEKIVKEMLTSKFDGMTKLSKESGISMSTLYKWKDKYKGQKGEEMSKSSIKESNASEKFEYILEASKMNEEELGKWLRTKGLHNEHLVIWKQELQKILMNERQKKSKELLESRAEIQRLEKELQRKEKALAEMAALVVLKKKVEILMSGEAV